jgi:hypothetical protein
MRFIIYVTAAVTMIASVLLAPPTQAQDYVFEIDGQQLTAAEAEVVRQADATLESGLRALQRDEWSLAVRDCYAAIAGYRNAGLSDVGRVSDWFARARACIADAHALSGNAVEACRIYRDNDYQTLRVRDPRRICEARAAAEEATVAAHDEYADLFQRFSGMTGRLQSLTEGSQARADLAEQMYILCDQMASYRDRVPGAFAGASYCTAIVRFEAGQPDRACQILWTAARWTSRVDTSPMLDQQRQHVREMDVALGAFRQTCTDFGYPWPSFNRDWPVS